MSTDRPSAAAMDAARLLSERVDGSSRAAIIDRLLDDPATLQALRLALPLRQPASELAARIERQAGWRRWLDGWSLAGLTGAAAAALMLLATPGSDPLTPSSLQADSQPLVADVLLSGSFEPSTELFGGDFEG